MNGSRGKAAQLGNKSKTGITKEAKRILSDYLITGQIHLPYHFTVKGKEKLYTHDGDATANRNLWESNRKIYTNPSYQNNKRKPEYIFNTVKK